MEKNQYVTQNLRIIYVRHLLCSLERENYLFLGSRRFRNSKYYMKKLVRIEALAKVGMKYGHLSLSKLYFG